MFCPNCGNDCGNAKFCVKCGTKVEQAANEPVEWSVGMPCPHCGGTKLEGQNCAFCGAQLLSDIAENSPQSTAKKRPISQINLQHYYTQFYPNRPAAIKALRAETQIGLKEAKIIIDQLFESHGDTTNTQQNIKFAVKSLWRNSQ